MLRLPCPTFLVAGVLLPHPRRLSDSPHPLLLCFLLQPQPHKSQPARKLPPRKDMKEQEKGEGSDSKESPKTKSDESGEEKNGDEDCQRGGQKKKGEWLGTGLGEVCRQNCEVSELGAAG